MTEAEAWLAQVESDYAAAQSVFQRDDSSTYCQAISKYQQVVEKSINVIDAVLREQGILLDRVQAEHYPLKMINRLVRLPLRQRPDLAANMNRIFTRWNSDIYDLCWLAPKLPPVGQRYQQNTEYPYQNEDMTWTAPAAEVSFTVAQVQRFAIVARNLRREAQAILTNARVNNL